MGNYLYNGVGPLPKLPQVDGYDFALLQQLNDKWFQVWLTKEQPHVTDSYVQFPSSSLQWDNYRAFDYHYTDDWGELGEVGTIGQVASSFIWTNHDILNSDGTLYLAASEPIPVGTAPALDPLSLFLGWKAGNWVARQRGKKKPATGVYDDTMPIEWKMQDVANNKKIPYVTYQIYSYNGLEFGRPDIEADSDYKYHLIEKYSSGYHYWCLKQPFVYVNEDKEYAKIEGGYNYSLYICKTGKAVFGHHDDISGDNLKLNWENIIWTNTDICDADGTVRMAATEPVYIREQVEDWLVKISNYIPTDEMINNHAISIQSGGDEFVLSSPYASPMDDDGNNVAVVFMDFEVGVFVFMFYFKQEIIAEGQAVEPGLYYIDSIPSMYPPGTKFKFYIPDET